MDIFLHVDLENHKEMKGILNFNRPKNIKQKLSEFMQRHPSVKEELSLLEFEKLFFGKIISDFNEGIL